MHYWLAGESSAAIDIYGAAIYYTSYSANSYCATHYQLAIFTYVSVQT